MSDDLISVIDLARQLGKRKQTVFKVLRRLNINTTRQRGDDSRGQLVAYVTPDDAGKLRDAIISEDASVGTRGDFAGSVTDPSECGYFYLLSLEPKHDPGRIKVGFATSIPQRLRQLRCSAPLAEVVGKWPCKRLWEKTAIDSVTAGCERLHTEVFRAASLESVLDRCKQFFDAMPKIESNNRG